MTCIYIYIYITMKYILTKNCSKMGFFSFFSQARVAQKWFGRSEFDKLLSSIFGRVVDFEATVFDQKTLFSWWHTNSCLIDVCLKKREKKRKVKTYCPNQIRLQFWTPPTKNNFLCPLPNSLENPKTFLKLKSLYISTWDIVIIH